MRGVNANANNVMSANTMAASQNFSEFYGAWFAIRQANQKLELFSPQESTCSLAGTEKGEKFSWTKFSFWCELKIPGTIGTKREKCGEKYSGVKAPKALPLHYNNRDYVCIYKL